MSALAIRVSHLGKQFRLGRRERYFTLRDSLSRWAGAPWRLLRGAAEATESIIWALRDVSFEVRRGEAVGIIGANGAGKSTLLKLLSRITEPTTGEADIHGRVGSLLEVGTGFHAELTGRENVFLNGAILGMRRQEITRKFADIVAYAEVERFIDTPVKHYSSGMYMRLAFAVAAQLQPEILLVDEVLAVGDIEFQKRCIGTMEQLTRSGRTVILVSHNMGTVRSLCTTALLLEKGQLRTAGTTEAVVRTYLAGSATDAAERALDPSEYLVGTGDKVGIQRVQLLQPASDSFSVHWSQPITLAVDIEVREAISDLSIGAGLKMMDGTWVFCVHQDDQTGSQRWSLSPGRYRVKVTMRNDMKPGLYKLAIGAHHHHYSKTLFHVEPVTLEVLDHSADGNHPRIYNPGVIEGCASWEGPESI